MSNLSVKNGVIVGGSNTKGANAKFKVGDTYADKSVKAPTTAPGAPSGVQANQDAAAKLGVKIPGVGGGSLATDTTAPPPAPTSPVAAPQAPITPQAPTAPVETPAAAPTPTQNKYQQGLANLQASGVAPPSDAGAARITAAAYTPEQPDTSGIDQFLSQDPAVNSLMANIATLLNPPKQTTTLMQDYNKLYKQSGLDKINEELIDADTVINGTEDDIRNEIQTAGGFGTESQVQAMSLARNKGLLKRYNQLVQMKTDATNQLNTLSQLNQQDKQMAQQKVDSQVSAMFNMANFRQQAVKNSREQYQWLATQMGADGLYNSLSQDPRQLAFAEKILGTGPGGLQQLAVQATTDRAQKAQMTALDMEVKKSSLLTDAAQRANIYSEISARNNPKDKPLTQAQATAAGYAQRAREADAVVRKFGNNFTGAGSYVGKILPNFLKSSDRQEYEQAQRNFINAVLRPESGASISPAEFDNAQKQYFPQPGDSNSVVIQKADNRNTKINNLYSQASYGNSTVSIGGQEYEVGSTVSNGSQTGTVNADGTITY